MDAEQMALECAKRILERDPHVTDTARRPIDDQAACVARYVLAAAPPVAADDMRCTYSCGCQERGKGGTYCPAHDKPIWGLMPRDERRPEVSASKPVPVAADIAEGREVLAKMTPGEWHTTGFDTYNESGTRLGNTFVVSQDDTWICQLLNDTEDNSAGIAYLRNHAAAWLDELARLRAEAVRLQAVADKMQEFKTISDGKCWTAIQDAVKAEAELARLRAAVPGDVLQAAYRVYGRTRMEADPDAITCARYIASIAEPAAGKQLADIHYNATEIHDGPP